MDQNYSEIICTAIDEIVTARLQGLQYDITKQCIIVDDTYSHQGKYIVSDGTSRYEVYSKETTYRDGNSVLVNIPNGDYNMQKTIVCRISADDTTPFNYVSPMDTMIKITNNIFDDAKVTYGDNAGLLANDSNKSSVIGPIYSLTEAVGFAGFTRLGITANFKSLLNGLDVASGTHGLKLLIYTETSTSPGVKDNTVYELSFNSSDMVGNPYQFESYFYQEKVFDISSINNIKQIDVYFYQDGQFYDGNDNYIDWQYNDTLLGSTRLQNNLFVNDVKIYLGYDMGSFTQETLLLYTNDALTYHYTNNPLYKTIALRWIHKIDDKTYQLLSKADLTNEFEIHWFRYKKGCESINQYAGNDWEEIQPSKDDPFKCSITPDIGLRSEQIKVIGLQKTITGEDIITITPYYSNLLTFENEENIPDKITYDAATALSIICEDGSEGNYYLYNQNGKIENEGSGKGNKRYLKAMFQGAEIDSNLGLGASDYIKWYFPTEKTMLNFSPTYFTENDGEYETDLSYYGIDYTGITRGITLGAISGKPELTSTRQAYSIGNQWNYENSNNTVRCVVRIKGVEYEAIEELRFGKAGTNGTNTTFLIEFVGNENALIVNSSDVKNTIDVRARLYDSNGSNIGFTDDQAKTIIWSWYKQTEGVNKSYITLPENVKGDTVTLTCNTNSIPNDNYFILKATYGKLEAYLPIPLKTDKTSHIEGAREVIYNNMGTPAYYSDAYVMYYYEGDSYEEAKPTWTLQYDETTDGETATGYIPTLQELPARKGYKGLSASSFYASGYNDKVCVSGIDIASNSGWSQPILIMQSQYDFAMLNKWDGQLTIDENNGTILSTMLGAGRKNENNTFSGVLIGDVKAGTGNSNDTNTLTGVYGLHEGQTSFALKEDGTATFGKAGKGQILIDGNSSTLQSANYATNNYGTKINLETGLINILGDNASSIKLQPNSTMGPYLSIISNTNTSLISIGKDDYFLQSNNYTKENAQGSKLDLSNGDLEIKSPYGRTVLSGGDSSKYFEITVPPLSEGKPGTAAGLNSYTTPLLTIGKDDYYLQSINFAGLSFNTTTIKEKKYNLYNSGLVAVSGDGETVYTRISASDNWTEKIFEETEEEVTRYNEFGREEKVTITISEDSNREAYLATLLPYYSKNQGSGLKMDLSNGIINGYDLLLKGTKSDDVKKTIIIDSSSSTTPLKIGSDFSVNWDGTLTCNKLNSLNNDGNDDKAISISNNFYVTKGGGAGGSGVKFSGGFSGYMSGKGNFSELTVNDLTVGTINNYTYKYSVFNAAYAFGFIKVDMEDAQTSAAADGHTHTYRKIKNLRMSLLRHKVPLLTTGLVDGETTFGSDLNIT